tara:strand:- start:251 stop:643 length:393 start_codon:yes stop_codon:yes gene_type:complete
MSSTLTVTNLNTTNVTATNLTDGGGTTSTFANINSGISRAWSNSSSTAIRDSFGISSFTDNGTGDYSHALTNSFSSTNYVMAAAGFSSGARTVVFDSGSTASSARVHVYVTSSGSINDNSSNFALFGDLA